MKKQVEKAQRNAAECRALASSSRDESTRAAMLDIVHQWEAVALAWGLFFLGKAHSDPKPPKR
jgi:hypothetical protein